MQPLTPHGATLDREAGTLTDSAVSEAIHETKGHYIVRWSADDDSEQVQMMLAEIRSQPAAMA